MLFKAAQRVDKGMQGSKTTGVWACHLISTMSFIVSEIEAANGEV
jgi:hypothetical protein